MSLRFILYNVRDFLLHDATGEAHLATGAERDRTGGESEERMVHAGGHAWAGGEARAALADDNRTRFSLLTDIEFDPKILGV